MNARELLVVAGTGVLGLALLEMGSPRLLRPPLAVEMLSAVGVLLLVYAYFILEARDEIEVAQTPTPDPEVPMPTATPGADLLAVLRELCDDPPSDFETLSIDGLKSAAFDVLTRYKHHSPDHARGLLANGRWTDDPYAASLFATVAVPLPLGGRIRSYLVPRLGHRHAVRHAANAIAELAGVGVPDRTVRTTASDWTDVILGDGRAVTTTQTSPKPSSNRPMDDRPSEPAAAGRFGASRPTNHWYGIGIVTLVGLGLGLLLERPAILLAGVVGLGYAAYARTTPLGDVQLSVGRTVRPERPRPGDEVVVTVTVGNEGSTPIPDLRLVDGVPIMLSVTDGSPRYGTPLRPGESASYSYTVRARRGRHSFQPLLAIARNLPGTTERAYHLSTDTAFTCVPPLRPLRVPVPLRDRAVHRAGSAGTSVGGSGLEFHSVRRYRPGDPMNRIDWKRFARTGVLSTRELREERTATIVLAIDVLPSAYVSPGPSVEHAVDRSVEAAGRIFATLLDDGHRVGITTIGPVECWLPPATGRDHRANGRARLALDPAFSTTPRESTGDPTRWQERLRQRLPDGAQVYVISPLCDPLVAGTIRRIDAWGHPVVLLSPDPTTARRIGNRLARVRRTVRLTEVRRDGVPSIDWPWADSLDRAMARAGVSR